MMLVLIPAYKPDMTLADLLANLRSAAPRVRCLVVDDGSGAASQHVFDAVRSGGTEVLTLPVNRGKGAALRAGLAHASAIDPGQVVVTADADGQHTVADILRVGRHAQATGHITLGVRSFGADTPLRSRVGNLATAKLFGLATGWALADTQTGLRAFPASQIPWLLEVPGQRYDYELRVLLAAAEQGLTCEQVPIATVYEAGNPTSHFHPVRDSLRIWAPLVKFSAASGVSFLVDYVVALALATAWGGVFWPVVVARLVSGSVNFALNRRVFRAAPSTVGRTAVRYAALAVAVLVASWLGTDVLVTAGVPFWAAKPVVDLGTALVSFTAQRRFVFREKACAPRAAPPSAASPTPTAGPSPTSLPAHTHGTIPPGRRAHAPAAH
ncbi:bifunctional glycosyltransferase family 2/GtrA family protein [Schaalia sp. 19OD2882]|uniref:bifunctional glycosyltransferase family 2/GtrA family protein n=1 Tax=Schaalia sp. 19OD2882 TaxID=2794089 RepID=UPI001C1EB9A7|nr:bifunctional glycosyltransferase family 2/GtrA family protein [Schaalia sp. 19OD2882]QWW19345.1 bifunctional glycosyltransferase family 2/GtrA family protein [Schaalia sp. 19OD2882]